MKAYEQSKKARRIEAIVYLILLMFILGGTWLSQDENQHRGS
jgi:hypothetical protein